MYNRDYHIEFWPGSYIRKVPLDRETIVVDKYAGSNKFYQFVKRGLDVCFSITFILGILTWLTPFLYLIIRLDSRGSLFFVQRRVGKNGRLFNCIKFRTMVFNDEANEKQAETNDYRITRIGKFLRETNIDELPQFINILRGDMSFIGPRPHMVTDCTRFSFVIPGYNFRSNVRPGLTGLAQMQGHHGPTLNYESIFMRYHWDAEYVRHTGFALDLKITLYTFFYFLSNFIYFAGYRMLRNDRNTAS